MKDIKETLYTQGFNHGYLLAQHEPDLTHILAGNKNEQSHYFQGMIAGQQEYDLEQIRERLKEISKNQPQKDDKEIDRER